MAKVDNCDIPEDLLYWVEKHVWAKEEEGLVKVGVTDVAQSQAQRIIAFRAKPIGRPLEKGKSLGTLESGKWVGPVPAPLEGEIAEVNSLVEQNPALINQDPYGAAWLVKMKPADWARDKAQLVSGIEGVEAYRKFLQAEGISCG